MRIERITLYHYPATRSARVKWLLHELLDDAFDVERVDLYAGAQYEPEFLAHNPNHAVPTLAIRTADGGRVTMAESGAMVVLLADTYADRGLAPAPAPFTAARADYLQTVHFCGAAIDMMLWQIRVHTHVLPAAGRDAATRARYLGKFRDEVEPQLARRLTEASHVCGPDFSAADCMVAHAILWARSYGLCEAPAFRAYLSRVSKRPAFAKAFADAREFDPKVPEDAPVHGRFTG